MNKKLRVGVIGAGTIAKAHLDSASGLGNVQLATIADIIADKAKILADKYDMTAYTDYRQMIGKEKLDIVIINLPHFLHREAAIECSRAGCHVLLEKPMAMNEFECDDIIKECEKYQTKLMIGHMIHFSSDNMKAREIVQSGSLGKLLSITSIRYANYFTDSRPEWFLHYDTAGGGIVMNLGAHSIDLIQFLTGTRIQSVRASVGKYAKGIEVEGNAQIFAMLENNVTASITLSGYKTVPHFETELVFTGGMLKLLNNKLFISKEKVYHEVNLDDQNPFGFQLSEFIQSIEDDKPIPITGEYGKSVIKAIKAVYASSDKVVEITI